VAPAELEGLLLSLDAVADCAVIGVPDLEAGERPRAFVVRKVGHAQLTEQDVQQYVASKPSLPVSQSQPLRSEHVAHYKQLTGGVEFVDEIPKSPSGKILRRVLRDRVKAKM
jgi:acyl-coenzyme A synthetase/AMP-(fatty) acid ligase